MGNNTDDRVVSLSVKERYLVYLAMQPYLSRATAYDIARCACVSMTLCLDEFRRLVMDIQGYNNGVMDEAMMIRGRVDGSRVGEKFDVFMLTGKRLRDVWDELARVDDKSVDYVLTAEMYEFIRDLLQVSEWVTNDPVLVYSLMKKFGVDFTKRKGV